MAKNGSNNRQYAFLLCRISLVSVLSCWAGPAGAVSQTDITWPSYYDSEVQRPTDPGLDCQALDAEIAHVGQGVSSLTKAQLRVEDMLHTAFDLERYGKEPGPGGGSLSAGAVNGKEAYSTAREQIIASRHNAQKRRAYLESLRPACKPKS
jgi:hypothetical protein